MTTTITTRDGQTATLYSDYTAAPAGTEFRETDAVELREIRDESYNREVVSSGLALEEIYHQDRAALDDLIPRAEAGLRVWMARDDDGLYFAIAEAADDAALAEAELDAVNAVADQVYRQRTR